MGINPPPMFPPPDIRPSRRDGKKCQKELNSPKHKKEKIEQDIEFYKYRLNWIYKNKPIIFKKKWKQEIKRIECAMSDLEYKLLKYTNPEIFNEIEEIAHRKA